jgi:hypothetical protein
VEATDDPSAVLHEAVSLMRQGRYAEALQKHLWFHDHALEYRPSLGGVRLSFALGYWLELAQVYPDAMQALTAVRDRKAQALSEGRGSFELFHDVAAINRCLSEDAETVALFKRLHQADPEVAGRCYHVAEKYLVAHREYETCAAYIPDPVGSFEGIRQRRQVQLEVADENPALGGSHLRDFTEARFADAVGRLVEILAGVGRRQDAERVRELALAVSASTAVRAALEDALPPPPPGPKRPHYGHRGRPASRPLAARAARGDNGGRCAPMHSPAA